MSNRPSPLEAAGLFFSGRRAGGYVRFRAALVDREYNELAYTVIQLPDLIRFRDQLNMLIEAGAKYETRPLPDVVSPQKEQ